ncbi:hypothetical protein D8674_005475 [Pyrus ussuriensis x Pyrus communis]|uniref:Uncharacterized protein n=1 Tax=Pyrus ussuriensis x Pyrus communis TaxID=2448454 RepID=A0A5N5FRJ8_9ROSA|nr:hypothetical protein D8674_005475 [Pyrus ussuriensis x Pyrus communis]
MHGTNVAGAARVSKWGRQDQPGAGIRCRHAHKLTVGLQETGAASLDETEGSKGKVCGRLG